MEDKIIISNILVLKDHIDTPEEFEQDEVKGYSLEHALNYEFNAHEKLVRAILTVTITSHCNSGNKVEATCHFSLVFIYTVTQMNAMIRRNKNNQISLDPNLSREICNVTYSTSRGILWQRLQGTVFRDFTLPVIDPVNLLRLNKAHQ